MPGSSGSDHGFQAAPHEAFVPAAVRRVLFVGNSLTYQPKELGGIPVLVARLALAAAGEQLHCEAVTKGGADLLDLADEFEAFLQRDRGGPRWGAVVLQVNAGAARPEIVLALQSRYGPLLSQDRPGCQVVLYQTWLTPACPDGEASSEGLEVYRTVLAGTGLGDVRAARVGTAYGALFNDRAADPHIYPALWKDDAGHPSVLAGLLIAATIVLTLEPEWRRPQRPWSQVLEAILPSSWRTASAGYAGDAQVGQRGWLDGRAGGKLPAYQKWRLAAGADPSQC